VLNSPTALILSSNLLVYNEMFSMVNIYNTNLAVSAPLGLKNSPGQLLAWNASSWTQTPVPQFQAGGGGANPEAGVMTGSMPLYGGEGNRFVDLFICTSSRQWKQKDKVI
jgi:hypothetical protein